MKLKVGSKVKYRRGFSSIVPVEATITDMDYVQPGEKYGTPVQEVEWDDRDHIVCTMSDGSWAYGEQIDELLDEPTEDSAQ